MSTYLLVHGGDRDGSIWLPIKEYLEKHGHLVYTPSMSSVKTSTLSKNIDEVLDTISSHSLNDIILGGHSYGAMVITGVFNRVPDKINQLVFIDSAVPEDGKSLYGMFSEKGFDYKDYDLTPDPACLEKLYFDEQRFSESTKTYIHCLQSEFLALTKPIYQSLKNSEGNWHYFCLDTVHGCMFTQPRELAIILNGLSN